MWRLIALVLAAYIWGSSSFDGMRPQPIDRALKSFHTDITASGRDMGHAMARFTHTRVGQFAGNLQSGGDILRPTEADRAAALLHR